jgi:hypothetical protein
LTGAAQIFNLHEALESQADSQKPGGATASPAALEDVDDKPGLSTLALKTFLWMGITQTRQNAWPACWRS